ncbi:uncharacterized protein LOC123520571 [Portunus trituberculatus]|uniref:uncharacterized protein LOC123520571 n=1 Tax=Portunus trituberculatus TaxID=210409 RepID=UPI001E1CBC75|nr:uncharacterized protein LOC123520571 [Portunus trituberculatus]
MANTPPLLLLLLLSLTCCSLGAALECSQKEEEIACSSEEKCVKLRYVCDGENDCEDGEDEDPDLCMVFKSHYGCEREEVACRRNGEMECMRLQNYCQMTDPPCQGPIDAKMCKVLNDNTIQKFSSIFISADGPPDPSWRRSEELGDDLVANLNNTVSHPDCPEMFTMVGDQCLSVFSVGKVSWGEARAFCRVLGGDLLTFKSVTHFTTVIKHLQDHQLTSDFWLGGRQREKGRGWTWLDDTTMVLGSPYWAVRRYDECQVRNITTSTHNTREANGATCYHYRQAPEPSSRGFCAGLSYTHFFYMTDEDCMHQKSPLCVSSQQQSGGGGGGYGGGGDAGYF